MIDRELLLQNQLSKEETAEKLERQRNELTNMYQCSTLEVKSPGFDEAYQKHLEKELKYTQKMMWWAFAGWVFTLIFYNF